MTSITIRDVPDDARNELAARAARGGRSLQEFLRGQLIDIAARPDAQVVANRVRERKQLSGSRLNTASILLHRGGDRR